MAVRHRSFDIDPLHMECVDDILSWFLCSSAPEVIDPFEVDPLDKASVLWPFVIEPELEGCAAAKLETAAPKIKAQAIALA
jgi:hypothetical protein